YSPVDGEWLSQDPLSFSAHDANLYRYAFNQPDDLRDPSGEILLWIGLGAVAGVILLWPPEANVPPIGRPPRPGRPIMGGIVGGVTVLVGQKGGAKGTVIGAAGGFCWGLAQETMNVLDGKNWDWVNVRNCTIAGFYAGGVSRWAGSPPTFGGSFGPGLAGGAATGITNWNPQPPHNEPPPKKKDE
ncbi:MAG: hypothetical protein ACREHG_10350, partial [Candidatus Saccharimonadales bacterium]